MGADPSGLHMDKVSECTASGLSFQELSSRLSSRVFPTAVTARTCPIILTEGLVVAGSWKEEAGRKAARQLNPGFWQLVGSFYNLDSLPPTSWDAGFTLTCLKAPREGKVLFGIG